MEIARIVLKMGKQEVSLSVEEAKKLKALLDEMFGKAIEIHHDHWYWRPTWTPQYPNTPIWYGGSVGTGTITFNANTRDVTCATANM